MSLRGVGVAVAGLVLAAGLVSGCADDGSPESSPAPDASQSADEPPSGDEPTSNESSEPRTTPEAEVPRTYDDALDHFDTWGSEPVSWRKFLMPSGNIYCNLNVKGLPSGCEINEGSVKDPAVCGKNPVTKYVGRVEFRMGRATPVCNTDTIRTQGARVLDYGTAARFKNTRFMCLSETIGVTCINTKQTEGFFLHRGEYVIFNAG